ncbi:MAG: hypothetical protein M3Q48_00585, partial [Actinomycetota bacterium]|nr:hypothetical protein [Actinomycetota bacterium]
MASAGVVHRPAPAASHRLADGGAGLLALVAALVLPLAFSPEAYHSFWAPKAAVCLLLVGPGLVAVAHLWRTGVGGARPAALFLVAAAVSALLSDNVVAAVIGSPNWGMGVVFVAVLVGAWALGAAAGPERRHQIVLALVAGAAVNAAVAWLQARGLVPPPLESPGRSMGLAGNAVHAGALFAGGLWLCGELARRARRWVGWL